jgi:uroporphyrinogen-III synthase
VTPRTVLVTRPAEDAGPLARRIEALGHRALCEPLLVIRFLDGATLDLDGAQALAFTSANGVRALMHTKPDAPRLGLRVFAVGKATAAAARAAGFGNVAAAGGDVNSLARNIVAELRPDAGAVVHVAGRERAGDLSAALAAKGFDSRRAVLYAADAVESFSPATVDALRSGAIDDVVIFSPRTARGFVTLLARAGLAREPERLRLVALSHRVVEAAQGPRFAAVAVAARPDQDALLDLLDTGASGERQER